MPTKNFVTLHNHSDFSTRDCAQTVEQIVSKAQMLNMPAVALTDHGMAGGLLQLKKECAKKDIKPIFGIEPYCAPTSHLLKEKIDNHSKTSYHLTILAKNYTGLQNIFRLSSLGWIEGYYYRPRISLELLEQHKEGLIVLSGCAASRLNIFITEDRFSEAISHLKFMKDLFKGDFYIEIQNHGLDWQIPLKAGSLALADKLDIPVVITQDSHYQGPEDAELHKHICKLAAGDLEFDSDQNWFKSRSEMEEMFPENEHKYLDTTLEIADKCNVEWDYSRTIWPVYPLPEGRTAEDELRELAWKGFNKVFNKPFKNVATQAEYTNRLEEELEVITSMKFSPYFLIVQDYINWCRENDILTSPGRGSAAGSLVCYCLGITEVDPIKYGLLFSRFLNSSRVSLPDIDYDCPKDKRDLLIKYIADKYGQDKMSQIGTYGVFKPRSALRAFARTLGYDISVGNKLASMVPGDIAGKQLKFKEVLEAEPAFLKVDEQDVIELAKKSEGIKTQIGVHAAGVVIADKSITDYLPLFLGKHKEIASQFDMHDVEDIGLVKFDFLGLKNLTVIANTIKLVEKLHNITIDFSKIEDGDPITYKLFNEGDLDGIFQFENSSGFKELCMQIQPNNISDLSTITSIFRPGPLGTHITENYVKRRNGERFKYDIPELEPVLSSTYGCLIYQEQIMQACIDIAKYTMPEADNMRRIVGKKKRKDMAEEEEKFISSCVKNGLEKKKATELFKMIEGFALYGFNKSHGISYSYTSYRTAWLKAHYQKEFYTALLNTSLENVDDLVKYTYSAREHGIQLIPPDINRSDSRFKLDNGAIIFGLSGVKGIGEKGCTKLIEARPKEGFIELADLVKAKINKNIIVALAECGALESICDLSRNQIVEHIPDLITYYKKLDNWEEMRQKRIVRDQEIADAVAQGVKPPRKLPKLKDKPELKELGEYKTLSRRDRLDLEKKTLGIYLTGHPLDDYSRVIAMSKYTIRDILQGDTGDRELIKVPVVLSSFEKKFSKSRKDYGTAVIEDQTGRMDVTIFSKNWKKINKKMKEGTVNIATGFINKQIQDDGPPIVRMSITDIEQIQAPTKKMDILIELDDGTKITFPYNEKVNLSKWQQAMAYAENIGRRYH